MTKVNLFNLRLVFILVSIAFLLIVSVTKAQTGSPSPQPSASPGSEQGVIFPIKELGNCENKGTCLTYCDDPVNYSTCVEYAKSKGFYVPDKVQIADEKLLEQAKNDLGCDSKEACLDFCSKDENKTICDTFSKNEGLIGGFVQNPDKSEFLDKAKDILGCDSGQSCSTFCDNPANSQKCSDFANSVGLLGGEVKEGPGGCNSDQTCQNFCSDPNNFDKCKPYAPANTQFQGPGGCNSPDTCRSHCEQNPDSCRSYSPGSNGTYVPVSCPAGQYFGPGGACTADNKTQEATSCAQGGKYWSGNSCQDTPPSGINPRAGGAFFQTRADMGNCSTPGECYDFCKANPGKCNGFNDHGTRPPDTYIPNLYYTPGSTVKQEPIKEMGNCSTPGECYDYCKENPGKCQGFDSKAPRPLDTYVPGTYYTPPQDIVYTTPPATNFYVTPMYYTPPPGSNYTTPSYYTPGIYSTPSYYTPPRGSEYTSPSYYTPGTYYATPQGGNYPTPNYNTPTYYTPPPGSNYNTPSYYTPASYTSPSYYTPPPGSSYTSPTYYTPAAYNTPTYNTPYTGGNYTTPTYYTPPPGSNYTTPTYNTPSSYNTPSYYTPPPGSTYTSPSYYTPSSYSYPTPSGSYSYPTPSGTYSYPTPSESYNYPTPSGSYSYPTPSTGYSYPTPSSYSYPTPGTPPPPPPSEPPPPPPSNPPPPPPPSEPPPPPPPPPGASAGMVAGITSTSQGLIQQIISFLFGNN